MAAPQMFGMPLLQRQIHSQLAQGLRALLKDGYHFNLTSAAGEAEAFEKLQSVRYSTVVNGEQAHVRVVVRSNEFAVADGFILAWRGEIKDVPSDDATYPEVWEWAQAQSDLVFIAFDVKTLHLVHGADWQSARYYNWTSPSMPDDKQSEHVQFVVAMVEGVDQHMAIIPAQSWIDARDQSFGTETLIHGMPLWIPLGMVADDRLEAAFTRIIQAVIDKGGWTNPSNDILFEGWSPVGTTQPEFQPGELECPSGTSYKSVKKLQYEIEACGGRMQFNPFAPVLFDFILWLPDVGLIWIEHKVGRGAASSQHFETGESGRRNPFHVRRLWHFVYCQGDDGVMCIPRNLVDYTWAASATLPKDIGKRFSCDDFAHAVKKVIKPYAEAARAAVFQAVAELTPADVTEGLETDKTSAPLKASAAARDAEHDPLMGMMIRRRNAPGASSIINRWCRTAGEGVCIVLGGGNRAGSLIVVDHLWSDNDKLAFDTFGELPVDLLTPGVMEKRYVPIAMEDHSMPSSLAKGVWFPFAQRKENWKLVLEKPRHLILGLLTEPDFIKDAASDRSSWYMLLPSGFTSKYANGTFVKESKPAGRSRGEQLTVATKLEQTLIPKPKWPNLLSTVVLSEHFLLDPNINPARYVLNLTDGTIYHEIMKILRADGMVAISNPLLRASENRKFNATEYQGLVGDMLRTLWTVGYERQDPGTIMRPVQKAGKQTTAEKPDESEKPPVPKIESDDDSN